MTASDDTVDTYLLQLAQALKHESFFQCDLVEFLLERSLNNQRIGHHLFWELKAEMNSPTVGLLYGMILEAYLAAAPEHWKILDQQVCDGSVISVGGGGYQRDTFLLSLRLHNKLGAFATTFV